MKKLLIINYNYNKEYYRIQILQYFIKGNFDTTELVEHPVLSEHSAKMKLLRKPWLLVIHLFALFQYQIRIIKKVNSGNFDTIIIGYPAYLECLTINLFCKRQKQKVYIDFFISLYDTIILDRKLKDKKSLAAKFFYFMDQYLIRNNKKIIVDTQISRDRFIKLFKARDTKFYVVHVGSYLFTKPNAQFSLQKQNTLLKIGWVGSFVELHGFGLIKECILQLHNSQYEFHLIGNSFDNKLKDLKDFINRNTIKNVVTYGRLDYFSTMQILNNCDICLGIFGSSEKAKSVIPFKIYDYLYLNKEIITQLSGAIDELPAFENLHKVLPNKQMIVNKITELEKNRSNNNSRDKLKEFLLNDYVKLN